MKRESGTCPAMQAMIGESANRATSSPATACQMTWINSLTTEILNRHSQALSQWYPSTGWTPLSYTNQLTAWNLWTSTGSAQLGLALLILKHEAVGSRGVQIRLSRCERSGCKSGGACGDFSTKMVLSYIIMIHVYYTHTPRDVYIYIYMCWCVCVCLHFEYILSTM